MFCAGVALATIWVMPLGLAIQIGVTVLFALIPAGVVVFWLGRFVEHHVHRLDHR
jgi:hypothetical protein